MKGARPVTAISVVLAGALTVLAAASAAAAAPRTVPPSVRVAAVPGAVTPEGRAVVVRITTAHARWCVLSSRPVVPGFSARLDCARGRTFRVAHVPQATGPAGGRVVLTVAAIGPGGRRVARAVAVEPPAPVLVPLTITTASLPTATAGVSYSTVLVATGGSAPYVWTVSPGVLPSGLSLAPDGTLLGTPDSVGSYEFAVDVTDSTRPTPRTAAATVSMTVAFAPTGSAYSGNWSGYEVAAGPFTAVTGTFDVPNLAPSTGETRVAEWVGIDGAANTSLIQAGVQEIYDPVAGSVSVDAWWEILPALSTPIDMSVSPGDEVTVAIGLVSGAEWQISLTDATNGQSFSTQQPYYGPGASAEWIVEAPTSVSGTEFALGTYSPAVTFTNLKVTGAESSLTADVMVQGAATVSDPSPLTATGFAVAYGAAPPPGP